MTDVRKQTLSELKIEIKSIPFIHPIIDLQDLDQDLRLIPKDQVIGITQRIQDIESKETKDNGIPNRKFKKNQLGTQYSIAKVDGELYAIYKGEKQKKLLGDRKNSRRVKIAQNIKTGKFVIYKIQSKQEDMAQAEYENLKKVDDAIGFYTNYSQAKKEDQEIILMELAEGQELFEIYDNRIKLPMLRLIDVAVKILLAVQRLHQEKKLLHLDIKLENIIYNLMNGKLKFIDVATLLNISQSTHKALFGTPGYAAPELLEKKLTEYTYNKKNDIYSLGKALAVWFDLSRGDNIRLVGEGSNFFRHNFQIHNKKIKKEILDFLNKMTNAKPSRRPDLRECVEFFTRIQNILLKYTAANVGIVDVKEYLSNSLAEKKAFIESLKKFDKVWFIETRDPYSNIEYIKLQREFVAAGIVVGNKIFHSPGSESMDVMDRIPQLVEKNNPQRKQNYFYVTKNTKAKLTENLEKRGAHVLLIDIKKTELDYRKELLSQQVIVKKHHRHIESQLAKDIKFLQGKESKEKDNDVKNDLGAQITLLNEALQVIKKPTTTYQDIMDRLTVVENKLVCTGKFTKFITENISSKLFSPTVKGNIKNLRKEIPRMVDRSVRVYTSPRLLRNSCS